MSITANGKFVLVTDLEQGRKVTKGGILMPDIDDDNMGKKHRWCKVHSVGPRSCVVNDIEPGDWIYVQHLRWTAGFDVEGIKMWAVEDTAIDLYSKEQPEELYEKSN